MGKWRIRLVWLAACILGIFALMGCSSTPTSNKPATDGAPANQEKVESKAGSQKDYKAAVIVKDISLYEKAEANSNALQSLKKGNLVIILEDNNENWVKVEPICFSYPPNQGYIEKQAFSSDFTKNVPNQGMINKKDVYAESNGNSKVLSAGASTPVQIIKREKGWAYCEFTAGVNPGWVKESDIEYKFSSQLNQ